jgi:peptide/nickel transport system ATP-binding protein
VRGIPGLPPPHVIEDACPFAERCHFAVSECRTEHPTIRPVGPGHEARCLRTDNLGVIQPNQTEWAITHPEGATHDSLLSVRGVVCAYHGRHHHRAVDGVDLDIAGGEVVGLVGESGSGKSTLLRTIAGLHTQDAGTIAFRGATLPSEAMRRSLDTRRAIQIVFQHPDSSLNPRHSVARTLDRPLCLFHPKLGWRERRRRIGELLSDVRLDRAFMNRYPAEISGGHYQRVALARAFAADPDLILCDEVVSALDVSVQASILELLASLAATRETALLFVTHDLAVVRTIADRIYVMKDGSFCESASKDQLFAAPTHPYTRALLASVPQPDSRLALAGDAETRP